MGVSYEELFEVVGLATVIGGWLLEADGLGDKSL